jgi:DNA repair protein RadD
VFDDLVEGPQVADLIRDGFLVGTKVFAPSVPDLKGVHTRQGDYVESELAERMDKVELVGDIVSHWHRLAECRKTVVFATSVAHAIHLKEEFVKSGVRAEHIDGGTPKEMRDDILRRLSLGKLQLVTNCMVLTEGWDAPAVSCIVLARPTKSPGLFRQMVGRVLRPYFGKEHALVLDHAGAVFQHGFVEDEVVWTLDADKRAETPAQAARELRPSSRLLECSQCSAIRTGGQACPHCGFLPRRAGQHLDVVEGDLVHLGRDGKPKPNEWTHERRHLFHRQLVGVAMQRGYRLGWAAHQYKAKFGHWPPHSNVEPMVPNPEVTSWVRSRQIAYAKAMQKAAG